MPRFKLLWLFTNIDKFFIFFKFNYLLRFNNYPNATTFYFWNIFSRYFFSRYLIKFFYRSLSQQSEFFTLNLTKSFRFHTLSNFLNLFKKLPSKHLFLVNHSELVFNLYLTPIKLTGVQLKIKPFKILFTLHLILLPVMWLQCVSNFFFYLNYIFFNYNLQINRFYNTQFFKIYRL